jgi:transcriptional regulator with XRE-family HTH domain
VRLSFGEKMRIMMKRRGVSVQEVADRLGVSRQNVNQRLNADKFTLDDMEKYAPAQGYKLPDLSPDRHTRTAGNVPEFVKVKENEPQNAHF